MKTKLILLLPFLLLYSVVWGQEEFKKHCRTSNETYGYKFKKEITKN